MVANGIVVPEGETLILEAGVELRFRDTNDGLIVRGALVANGSASSPITFTSDDAVKEPGQWQGIVFEATSDGSASVFNRCVVEAAGNFGNVALLVDQVSPGIVDCQFVQSLGYGVRLAGSRSEIRGCRFVGNGGFAIAMDTSSFPVFERTEAELNGRDAIEIFGGNVAVSGTWDAGDLPYTITNDVTVSASATLTIEAGATVEFRDANDALLVEGALRAVGTADRPIRFTSDNEEKAPGQWEAIRILNTADPVATRLEECIVEYAGNFGAENLSIEGVAASVVRCEFRASLASGIRLINSDAVIQSCRFENNGGFAVFMDTGSFPTIRASGANGNGRDAIGISGGSVFRDGVWLRDAIPYTITNDVTIDEGVSLTIEAGTTVEFQDINDALICRGALIAEGATGDPIVFTSDEAIKAPGQWEGLRFLETVDTSATRLSFCVIESGGNFGSENLLIAGTSIPVVDCAIRLSSDHGIRMANSNSRVESCEFEDNRGFAMFMDTASFPVLDMNTGLGNGRNAIGVAGGAVSETGTWAADTLPYTITNDVTVSEGARLTIEPGTVVEFQDTNDGLHIDGALIARGTPAQRIRFLSNEEEGAPGQWESIRFNDSSRDDLCALVYCDVESAGNFGDVAVVCQNAAPTIERTRIRGNRGVGLLCDGASVALNHLRLESNTGWGLLTRNGAAPIVRSSVFLSNAGGAARNEDTSVIVDAQNNYWGDPTGPLDTRDDDGLGLLNEESEGGAVSEFVDWSAPLATEPEEEPAAGILSVSPVAIEFPETALGAATSRVVLVDNVGEEAASLVGVAVTGTGFGVDPLGAPIALQAGESVEIEIRFEPDSAGSFSGAVVLETTAENGPFEIPLSGVGIAGGGPEPGALTRVSASPFDDFGPAWDPSSERIAFLTRRPPAAEPVSNIAWVLSDGSEEALIAVGDNSGFGIGNSLSWIGSTGRLMTEERIVFHEYLSFRPQGNLLTRDISDGTDSVFTRELLIDGGGGGVMIRISRDGGAALWRFSSSGGSGLTSIRSAGVESLEGQSARSHGLVHIEATASNPDQRFVSGAGLAPDGSWFVISEASGAGLDLFIYSLDGSGSRRQLTFSGASEGARNVFPDVSPGGQTIAFGFQSGVEGSTTDVYTIDRDGSNLQNVTRSAALSETFPSWAPDGGRLALQRFDTEESGALGVGEASNWNIYVLEFGESPGDGVESGFGEGVEGWTVFGDAQGGSAIPDYIDEGGTPGGHLCADDNVAGGVWYWSAPDSFLGNQSAAYNGRLVFDLKQSSTSNQFDGQDLVLEGAGVTLVYDTADNPGVDWTHYEVVLNETRGWRVGAIDGPEPSRATYVAVLGALESLLIRGEFRSGSDRGCLDSVALVYGSGGMGEVSNLRIVREGSQARLIWGVTEPSYQLQSREFLDERTPWTDVGAQPVENDGRFEIVWPIDQASRFFRVVRR